MADILLLSGDRQRASDVRTLLRQDGHAVTVSREVASWRESERTAVPELIVAAISDLDEVRTHTAHRPRGFPAPLLIVQAEIHDHGLRWDSDAPPTCIRADDHRRAVGARQTRACAYRSVGRG